MAIYSIDEILELITRWEEHMRDYYESIVTNLDDERSCKTAALLKRLQDKTLKIIEAIDINEYKKTEIIKNIPDIHSQENIPTYTFKHDASPMDVFTTVLAYEEKLEEFYMHLRSIAVYEKTRDILDMLVQSKMGQIKQIKAFMDDADMVG